MDFQWRCAQLRQTYDATKFQFVNVELDLAITYCLIAGASTDRTKRNAVQASVEPIFSRCRAL